MAMQTQRVGALIWLFLATVAFLWVMAPFRSAVVWGIAASVLFAPFFGRLQQRLGGRSNLAAALSVLAMILALIIPAVVAGIAVVHETTQLLTRNESLAQLPASLEQLYAALPDWLRHLLRLSGSGDAAAFQQQVGRVLEAGLSSLLDRVIGIGQSALGFAVSLGVMIYITFFFIRDGRAICAAIVTHLPLPANLRNELFAEVTLVLHATLKGGLIVAAAQGLAGGLIFWMLGIEAPVIWGFAMAFMSLFPPFGTAIVWLPVAVFLLSTGAIDEGIILSLAGIFVIGLIDNLLRPALVGRDAKIPDYLVLLSTLGGLVLVGLDGIIVGPMIVALFLASWRMTRGLMTGDQRQPRPISS